MLDKFNSFLSKLVDIADSDGGHILILLLLIQLFLSHNAEAYLDLAIGALIMKLKDVGSNKARNDKPVIAAEVDAVKVLKTQPEGTK